MKHESTFTRRIRRATACHRAVFQMLEYRALFSAGPTPFHGSPAPVSQPIEAENYDLGGEIGHDAYHKQQTECDVYDPNTDTWSRVADMPLSKSHTESSTFVSNGKVIIAGGQADNYTATNTIEEYDPAINTWAILGNLPGVLEGTIPPARRQPDDPRQRLRRNEHETRNVDCQLARVKPDSGSAEHFTSAA